MLGKLQCIWEHVTDEDRYPWWRHEIETFFALLVLCDENPHGTQWVSSQRVRIARLWYFLCCKPEHTVEQIVAVMRRKDAQVTSPWHWQSGVHPERQIIDLRLGPYKKTVKKSISGFRCPITWTNWKNLGRNNCVSWKNRPGHSEKKTPTRLFVKPVLQAVIKENTKALLPFSLQWRHNGCDGVSNHQPHHCLLNRLFRHRSKKISKHCATGLCEGNSPGTGEFPAQMANNAENVSTSWRHYVKGSHRDRWFPFTEGQ